MLLGIPPYYRLAYMIAGLLVSVLVSTILGTPHTIAEPILYQKILFNLLIGGLIWGHYLMVILWLDRRYPWESSRHAYRWLRQMLLTFPVGLLLDWGGVRVRNALLDSEFIPHIFWYTDFPVLFLLTLLIHYLFQQAYLRHLSQRNTITSTPKVESTAERKGTTHLQLKKGKTTFQIPLAELAYVYRHEQINFLRQFDGQEWIWEQSLSALEAQLSEQDFFRVNRQLLLNRKAIQSYEVLPNRQTEISLEPDWEQVALLNKNRLAQFRQWLEN